MNCEQRFFGLCTEKLSSRLESSKVSWNIGAISCISASRKVSFLTWNHIFRPQASWSAKAALNELQMYSRGIPFDLSSIQHRIPQLSRSMSATRVYQVASQQVAGLYHTCSTKKMQGAQYHSNANQFSSLPKKWNLHLQIELGIRI